MSKRRVAYGVLRTKDGRAAPIKSPLIHAFVEGAKAEVTQLRGVLDTLVERNELLEKDATQFRAQLAELQNHPWVLIGRACGFVKIGGKHGQAKAGQREAIQAAGGQAGDGAGREESGSGGGEHRSEALRSEPHAEAGAGGPQEVTA